MEESAFKNRMEQIESLEFEGKWVQLLFLSRQLLKDLQESPAQLAKLQGKLLNLHLKSLVMSKNFEEALDFLRTEWSFSYAFDEISNLQWQKNKARVFAAHARLGDLLLTLRKIRMNQQEAKHRLDQLESEIHELLDECNYTEYSIQFRSGGSKRLFALESLYKTYLRHSILYPAGRAFNVLVKTMQDPELEENLAQRLMEDIHDSLRHKTAMDSALSNYLLNQNQIPDFLPDARNSVREQQNISFEAVQEEALQFDDWASISPDLLPVPGLDLELIHPELQLSVLGKFLLEGHHNLLETAVKMGADVDHHFRGKSLLVHSLERKEPEIFDLLLRYGANPNASTGSSLPILVLCKYSGLNLSAQLLQSGANPDAQSGEGNSALHYAVESADEKEVRLLLRFGANPLLMNLLKVSPYQLAREKGEKKILKELENYV